MRNQPFRQLYTKRQAKTRVPGPCIPGYQIEYLHDSRFVFINHTAFRCSPTQYKVVQFFLCHYNQPLMYEELITLCDPTALEYPELLEPARRKVVKIVSELRMKMWDSGLTIFSQYGSGYLLQKRPGHPLSSEAQTGPM